jgi:hypothetical protein
VLPKRGRAQTRRKSEIQQQKCHHKWTFVLNLFSTELPFTRGSFTASVRDHNLREASHLYYEGKE